MKRSLILVSLVLALMLIIPGCTRAPSSPAMQPVTVPPAISTTGPAIANPAAVFCIEKEYRYEIRKNPDGSEYGVCILPGGIECDEWAHFQGTCPAPAGPAVTTTGAALANPSATFCVSKSYKYRILKNPDGSEYGVCVFPSGKQCDGWEFFRGECNETTGN